jgi:hypothetical protein
MKLLMYGDALEADRNCVLKIILQGLLSRPDWDYVLNKCAIAAIPCGMIILLFLQLCF